jgi:hypothetical protein
MGEGDDSPYTVMEGKFENTYSSIIFHLEFTVLDSFHGVC